MKYLTKKNSLDSGCSACLNRVRQISFDFKKKKEENNTSVYLHTCEKCGCHIKIYSSPKEAKEMEELAKEDYLTDFFRSELTKRGYCVIRDKEYTHHGEVLLRELQEELADTEMNILAEIKDNQVIIYLQPESCCSLADEYKREPIKLPLLSLPIDAKGIKYFDYFPSSWKSPTFGFKKGEVWEGQLKDIWRDRDRVSFIGTDFPNAKTEMMKELVNKGFLWEGGDKEDNYVKAICPRCGWIYECKLTEKYMKNEEQKEMIKEIKKHSC